MAFVEYARTRGDWALAGAAVVVDAEARIDRAAGCRTGAGPRDAPPSVRCSPAPKLREAAQLAGAMRVTDDYGRALVAALVERALERARR